MQESSYRLNARGCHWGLVIEEKEITTPVRREFKVCSDFGIGQIYYKTARGFKFDINKILEDLDYSVEAGAIVLADFHKRYSHKEVDWWTRYNASSKHKRNIYKQLVERYL